MIMQTHITSYACDLRLCNFFDLRALFSGHFHSYIYIYIYIYIQGFLCKRLRGAHGWGGILVIVSQVGVTIGSSGLNDKRFLEIVQLGAYACCNLAWQERMQIAIRQRAIKLSYLAWICNYRLLLMSTWTHARLVGPHVLFCISTHQLEPHIEHIMRWTRHCSMHALIHVTARTLALVGIFGTFFLSPNSHFQYACLLAWNTFMKIYPFIYYTNEGVFSAGIWCKPRRTLKYFPQPFLNISMLQVKVQRRPWLWKAEWTSNL
jgi:hypothetical protein